MSNPMEETHPDPPNTTTTTTTTNHHTQTPNNNNEDIDATHEFETQARSWLSTLPSDQPLNPNDVVSWIQSNLSSVPDHIKSMPQSDVVNLFNSFLNDAGNLSNEKRLRESGCSDVDIMKNSLVDYDKKTNGKSFSHIEAWEIVRQAGKWLEQPCVGQASSSNFNKRRKSESGYYESGSNDNAETVIPDLNDDTNPTRKRKGKKTDRESSTKNSVVASFNTYMAKKTKLLEMVVEEKLANYELAEKLLAAQIYNVEEKALLRAMKFCNQPHNHITDPNMLAFTLDKKRELAEKYGWSCEF